MSNCSAYWNFYFTARIPRCPVRLSRLQLPAPPALHSQELYPAPFCRKQNAGLSEGERIAAMDCTITAMLHYAGNGCIMQQNSTRKCKEITPNTTFVKFRWTVAGILKKPKKNTTRLDGVLLAPPVGLAFLRKSHGGCKCPPDTC